MRKGLEALDNLYEYLKDEYEFRGMKEIDECKAIVEKELKALKIIKEKSVDVSWFCYSDNTDKYNSIMEDSRRYLTQEEFDLLREVLE